MGLVQSHAQEMQIHAETDGSLTIVSCVHCSVALFDASQCPFKETKARRLRQAPQHEPD
jgi:hypothetical protein